MRQHSRTLEDRPAHNPAEHEEHPPGVVELIEAVRQLRHSNFSAYWKAETYVLGAGAARQIIGANPRRLRALIWPDPGNTGPVWIAPGPFTAAPSIGADRPGGIALPPAFLRPLELNNAGEAHAFSAAAALVYVAEEFA